MLKYLHLQLMVPLLNLQMQHLILHHLYLSEEHLLQMIRSFSLVLQTHIDLRMLLNKLLH